MASTITNCIIIHPGAFWDPGSYSSPHSTASGLRFPINTSHTGNQPQSPSNAFRDAYLALPVQGGTIEIMPTDATYIFDTIVYLRRKPLTVIQHSGSNIEHKNDQDSSIFRVMCPLTWYNINAQYDNSNSDYSNRSMFLVLGSDLVSSGAEDAPDTITVDTQTVPGQYRFVRTIGDFKADNVAIGDLVRATGFATSGNNGVHQVTGVDSSTPSKYIIVRDALTNNGETGTLYYHNNASNFTIVNGNVSLANAHADTKSYYFVQAIGSSVGDANDGDMDYLLPGINLLNVNFSIRSCRRNGLSPTQTTSAWSTVDSVPRGNGLLKAKWCKQVRVAGCNYTGIQGGKSWATYGAGNFIWYEGCLYSSISDILVCDVNTSTADTTALPLIFIKPNVNEGSHINISDVFVEGCEMSHIVKAINPAWIQCVNVRTGRMAKITSAFKSIPADGDLTRAGKSFDLLFCGTHNCPGPTFNDTVLTATNQLTLSGASATNFVKHLSVDDYIRMSGWAAPNAQNNRMYKITGFNGPTALAVTPSPPVTTVSSAGISVQMQAWVADFEGLQDSQIRCMNNSFRKSDAPPYRLKNCKGVIRDSSEPMDNMGSQRFD